jgi:thioesterase domain-containing protein
MAAYFVNLIREIQPTGPYYLGGHSFGGRLAWAIARLMLDSGEAVALLALIDTFAPGQRAHATLRERIQLHAANLRGMALREWPRYFHGRLDTIIIRLSHNPSARSFIARFGLIPADVSVRNRMASAVYNYPFYPGKLTFFRVGERPYYVRADLTAGWKDYAAELEVHDVSGEHGSLLNEPYVATLAQALENALEDGRRSATLNRVG